MLCFVRMCSLTSPSASASTTASTSASASATITTSVLLVLMIFGTWLSMCSGASIGLDPAPGRSPGPPDVSQEVPPALSVADPDEQQHHLILVMSEEDDISPCDFQGDLIVVDAAKAAINVSFHHPLFHTNVLSMGLVYQVTVWSKQEYHAGGERQQEQLDQLEQQKQQEKQEQKSVSIQGFSLHSLGDGQPRGKFLSASDSSAISEKCLKSSVKGKISRQSLTFNWTLPMEPITRSNVTFRLRYKISKSSSIFQVNYAFAISQGCQLWLKQENANVTSMDIPQVNECQIYFPGHHTDNGLVLELTRLNTPCSGGGFLQFSGNIGQNYHRATSSSTSKLCGKLEEFPEQERRFYFPNIKEKTPFLKIRGEPVFAFNYYIVDYCYNLTFITRNGSFDLVPNTNLECTFKIFMPYGYKVLLKMEFKNSSQRGTTTSLSNFIEHTTELNGCNGLLVELQDGPSSWSHCSTTDDALRNIEVESTTNRIMMKVRTGNTNLGMHFRYRAEPIPAVVQLCSFGWVAVRQFCVAAFENVRLDWHQAELECNHRGGHLASIRSAEAQTIIDNILLNSPGYRDQNAYWLGATDKTFESDFRWSDGLPFSYANWFPGWPQDNYYNRQPNDDGFSEQDCVEARRAYHLPSETVRLANGFMWNDRDCNTQNFFLCERLIADEPVEEGWPSECNRTLTLTREQSRASVSSPGFPRHYPDNAKCETDILAPSGYRLVLDFEELVLEKEPLCSYDYLEIIEIPLTSSTAQGKSIRLLRNNSKSDVSHRLCGDWSAKLKLLRYVSTGSRIKLRFVSDYSHHYGGFKVRVYMESAMQCPDDRFMMYNNSCYLFVSYPEVTWSIAQNICKGMRAQLASVLSAEEERFITTNIRRTAEYRIGAIYWLGSQMSDLGRYKWVDGSDMTYKGWLPGQSPLELNTNISGTVIASTNISSLCLGVQWTTSPTPMLPSGLYWKSKKCSTTGGYVCKRHNQISGSELNFNRTINGSEGRLTSPNYPGNYYNNLDFRIHIVGPERTRIIIQFSKIDIEPQIECLYDFIEVRSVVRGNDNYNDAAKWCGSHETDMQRFDFVSESNEAEVHFHSDYSISGGGFSVIWHAVDVSGCPLQTLTAKEGVVTSPNYPHFLLARLDCAITILAPAGKRVWLEVLDYNMGGKHFQLGLPGLNEEYDQNSEAILELDLGGDSNAFQPFHVAGHLTDGIFVSNSERLLIRLRTADKPIGTGFKAKYKTVNGIQEERTIDLSNVTFGNIHHLNYPIEAPSNINFIQHFIAPLGNVILLELHQVRFSENDCLSTDGSIDVIDNYADNNGTFWNLCYDSDNFGVTTAPITITSYLNTLHIRQRNGAKGLPLNGSLKIQPDVNYKIKLLKQEENTVESCDPNPCQNNGKCISNGSKKFCQCAGHFTGLFCALTACELQPCISGQCILTATHYKCHCRSGYTGATCAQKQRPCEGNPCEGRGECLEKGDSFHCRCHAWWEGTRCERRLMHIPFRPLSERMLHEPFWLGLITVTVVLGIIGLVWCARRHFPEKLEKLLAEESDRNRCAAPSLRGASMRDQLGGGVGGGNTVSTAAVMVVPSPQPGCQRSLFGRLGIRKPSILSLTSPHCGSVGGGGGGGGTRTSPAAARTFSLDDLLKPPPRRTPSPRKKRNNSTPTKKNAAEKKQILQQLISPNTQQRARKMSIGELIQLSERKLKENINNNGENSENVLETKLTDNNVTSTAQITLSDPKLEKKVTFARLLNKVSAEMSSGSEVELQVLQNKRNTNLRASSTPASPGVEIRSPNSTSSNQGSDSLSSSDLALPTSSGLRLSDFLNKKNGKFHSRQKPASADSILAMFRNFSSTSAAANLSSSVRLSPSTTPTASTPQDDVAGDDDSTTSSIHTPVSFSSGLLDSPPNLRKQINNSTIEVPVLDPLSAHKSNESGSNFLHPPTILLEVPSINKCLSPIRELPTPLPTPLPSPCLTPILQRSNASSSAEDLGLDFSDDRISIELPCTSIGYSDDDEPHVQDIVIDIQAEDGLIQEEAAVMHQTCSQYKFKQPRTTESKFNTDINSQQSLPPPLIIPTLTIQQPSPTHSRPPILGLPGSPPPQRSPPILQENNFQFHEKPTRRLLKEFDKPTSLDLPCAPPLITVTFNMSEAESDAESLSPAAKTSSSHLGPSSGAVGMCYLSPFSMCSRADRTASESNLSSSGYSSMASPGPSRCGSNNPLCPSEMEDPGSSGPSSTHLHSQPRRPSPLLKTNSNSSGESNADNNTGDQGGHCRGRSDSETLSDDPLLESNDEGIGTDHIDEKIEDGELKSAKELEHYIGKDLLDSKISVEMPKLPSCLSQANTLNKSEQLEPNLDRLMPPISVCKVSLQLPSIIVQSESSGFDKYISPVSSRSESPLSDRTIGLDRFSQHLYNNKKDLLPFTDSDGLYDFPSSDCAPQNKTSCLSVMQHRKSTGRKRDKKSKNLKSPTRSTIHHYHLDVPSKDQHFRSQAPRKPSPKRRVRNQQIISSSSSSESVNSTRELKSSSSPCPSPDTIRWSSPVHWLDDNVTRRRSHDSSGEDTPEESSSIILPNVAEDTSRQSKKISRLRTISHQIRFLRRLEKSLKRRESLTCTTDSIDSGDGEEFARVTSPLLQSTSSLKPEIRKSSSIGKLQTIAGNTTRFKRAKTKKGGDLLIPQEEVTWREILVSGNGHSD